MNNILEAVLSAKKCQCFEVIFKLELHSISFFFQIVIECLPYIQSCLNPFVYCFMSKKFRENVRTSCRKVHPPCHLQACFCHKGMAENGGSQHYELESKVSQRTGLSRLTITRPSTSRSASSSEDPFCSDIKKNSLY